MAKQTKPGSLLVGRPKIPEILRVKGLMQALGDCSERHARREIAAGKFDVVRLGERGIGVTLESVERYISERTIKAGTADRLSKKILSK